MKYIYLITSPSGKQYVGKCTLPLEQKAAMYQSSAKYYPDIKRPILIAIRKYGWSNMKFEIIEQNNKWTTQDLNTREKYWIQYYKTLHTGYNITGGGEGHDSESAKLFWANVTSDWKQKRALNCSKGQLKRFEDNPESEKTKKRKSDAHNGSYRIESPDGKVWETDIGLKGFAEQFQTELKISYWGLFNAYRKCYTNTVNIRTSKNINKWIVTRIDKSDSRNLLEARSKD
jgi:group I intron endonuclease